MPSNSEFAQRQFREETAAKAERDHIARELRTLRGQVRALEEKVASLTTELAHRKVLGAPPRGFS